MQKHFIPKGTHISAHQLDNCYYHARNSLAGADDDEPEQSRPTTTTTGGQRQQQPGLLQAIGAFRTCNGLSGIIHVNNESLVIHPFYTLAHQSVSVVSLLAIGARQKGAAY